jgi:hypothetical protein
VILNDWFRPVATRCRPDFDLLFIVAARPEMGVFFPG